MKIINNFIMKRRVKKFNKNTTGEYDNKKQVIHCIYNNNFISIYDMINNTIDNTLDYESKSIFSKEEIYETTTKGESIKLNIGGTIKKSMLEYITSDTCNETMDILKFSNILLYTEITDINTLSVLIKILNEFRIKYILDNSTNQVNMLIDISHKDIINICNRLDISNRECDSILELDLLYELSRFVLRIVPSKDNIYAGKEYISNLDDSIIYNISGYKENVKNIQLLTTNNIYDNDYVKKFKNLDSLNNYVYLVLDNIDFEKEFDYIKDYQVIKSDTIDRSIILLPDKHLNIIKDYNTDKIVELQNEINKRMESIIYQENNLIYNNEIIYEIIEEENE